MNSREASDELMSSKKFQKLLEIILMVGNYLNTGSRNAQSLGFDLNYLTKVNTCYQINATGFAQAENYLNIQICL